MTAKFDPEAAADRLQFCGNVDRCRRALEEK